MTHELIENYPIKLIDLASMNHQEIEENPRILFDLIDELAKIFSDNNQLPSWRVFYLHTALMAYKNKYYHLSRISIFHALSEEEEISPDFFKSKEDESFYELINLENELKKLKR